MLSELGNLLSAKTAGFRKLNSVLQGSADSGIRSRLHICIKGRHNVHVYTFYFQRALVTTQQLPGLLSPDRLFVNAQTAFYTLKRRWQTLHNVQNGSAL